MTKAPCPDCGEEIPTNPATLGQRLSCPYCGADLEVISEEPLEFDWAYDWSWDDEEDLYEVDLALTG